jgi:peptide/nickel transport system ATP-binding protein
MQIIFQDPFSSLNPRMSVSETIMEPMKLSRSVGKAEMIERTKKLMDTVGLAERFWGTYPHELDGGRRQRIGIARALSLNPEFIVCDEPVSALDVSIQAQILNLLQDLQQEKNLTYMFITHDMSVVKHISNEIMVMYLGKCIERTSSDELIDNPVHPYTRALLSAVPVPDPDHKRVKSEIIKGELSSPIDPKPVCRFANRCPLAKEECLTSEPVLQEFKDGHSVACFRYKELI